MKMTKLEAFDGNDEKLENIKFYKNNEHVQTSGGDKDVVDTFVCTEDVRVEIRRIRKNVFLVSISFLLIFNAISMLTRLQSSLNRVDGMGVITSSLQNAMKIVSSMFLPKIFINFIGHKWTMTVCFFGMIIYMAANGYAVWATMIPASIIAGISASPMWTAQCSYFTIIAQRYADLTGQKSADVVSRFFGIFFMIFQMCNNIYFMIAC